jgi:hypothetical protein
MQGHAMGRAANDIELNDEQRRLFERMSAIIDRQDDPLALMAVAQDLSGELLRREGDVSLREQTLGEISRFFLGIIKAPNLSGQYKLDRLRMFARATVKILIHQRVLMEAQMPAEHPPGLARRAGDGTGAPH